MPEFRTKAKFGTEALLIRMKYLTTFDAKKILIPYTLDIFTNK